MKINDDVMKQQAELFVKNAPNDDWKRRGELTMIGVGQLLPVYKPHDWDKQELIGEATVAFFKFEKKVEGCFPFIGFTLAAMEVQGKVVVETCPVVRQIKSTDFTTPAYRMSHRFCPNCGKLDSVKSQSKRRGPECVLVRYYCKCGYEDYDAID